MTTKKVKVKITISCPSKFKLNYDFKNSLRVRIEELLPNLLHSEMFIDTYSSKVKVK